VMEPPGKKKTSGTYATPTNIRKEKNEPDRVSPDEGEKTPVFAHDLGGGKESPRARIGKPKEKKTKGKRKVAAHRIAKKKGRHLFTPEGT